MENIFEKAGCELSYGQIFDFAIKIDNKEDAAEFLKHYAAWIQVSFNGKKDPNGLTAMEIAKSNIGYYAGYYSNEVRRQIEDLFECEHPFFGSIAKNGPPTNEEALKMGEQFALHGRAQIIFPKQ